MVAVKSELKWNGAVVERFKAAAKVNGVSVGYRDGERYPDGAELGMVARAQEFGTPRIPPRPWIRPTLDSRKGHWARMVATALKTTAKTEDALRKMWRDRGKAAVVNLQQRIDKVNAPPLSAQTLAKRKARGNSSEKPLVDTRKMRDSLAYRVAGEEWMS